MKITKKNLIIGAVGIAGLASAFVGYKVFATNENSTANLVDVISAKFNLNKTEVQKVVEEHRQQMKAQKMTQNQQDFETKLAQLVTDKKLTQAQADKIKQKPPELDKIRQENREKGDKHSEDMMKNHQSEIETWMKNEGIGEEYRYLLQGKGFKGNHSRAGQSQNHNQGKNR